MLGADSLIAFGIRAATLPELLEDCIPRTHAMKYWGASLFKLGWKNSTVLGTYRVFSKTIDTYIQTMRRISEARAEVGPTGINTR